MGRPSLAARGDDLTAGEGRPTQQLTDYASPAQLATGWRIPTRRVSEGSNEARVRPGVRPGGQAPFSKQTCQPKKKDMRTGADPRGKAHQSEAVEDAGPSRTWAGRRQEGAHRKRHVPKYQRR